MAKIQAQSISLGNSMALDGAKSVEQELSMSLEQVKQQLTQQAESIKAQLMKEAHQAATDYLTQAKTEAAALRDAALAEAETIRVNAKTEGYEAGHLAGFESGHQTVLAELNDILTGAHAFHQAILQNEAKLLYESKRDLLALIQAICEQVLTISLQADPTLWDGIFTQALTQLTHQKSITIVLSDMTVGALQHACGEIPLSEKYPNLQLIADPHLAPHEVFLISAGDSHLELSITTQVKALLAVVMPEQWITPPDKLDFNKNQAE